MGAAIRHHATSTCESSPTWRRAAELATSRHLHQNTLWPSRTEHPRGNSSTDSGVCLEEHNDGRTECVTLKCQNKAYRRAEDEKIVALISKTHEPERMHAHEHGWRKPEGNISSVLSIQMLRSTSSKLTFPLKDAIEKLCVFDFDRFSKIN